MSCVGAGTWALIYFERFLASVTFTVLAIHCPPILEDQVKRKFLHDI
jgi:hypothetical protein